MDIQTLPHSITQSFTVEGNAYSDLVYLHSIDLFFKSKDPNNGVALEIRRMDNGYPSTKLVPFGRCVLENPQVKIDKTEATFPPTKFRFPSLVALERNKEYCFTVIPVPPSPEYQIYTSKTEKLH